MFKGPDYYSKAISEISKMKDTEDAVRYAILRSPTALQKYIYQILHAKKSFVTLKHS